MPTLVYLMGWFGLAIVMCTLVVLALLCEKYAYSRYVCDWLASNIASNLYLYTDYVLQYRNVCNRGAERGAESRELSRARVPLATYIQNMDIHVLIGVCGVMLMGLIHKTPAGIRERLGSDVYQQDFNSAILLCMAYVFQWEYMYMRCYGLTTGKLNIYICLYLHTVLFVYNSSVHKKITVGYN